MTSDNSPSLIRASPKFSLWTVVENPTEKKKKVISRVQEGCDVEEAEKLFKYPEIIIYT